MAYSSLLHAGVCAMLRPYCKKPPHQAAAQAVQGGPALRWTRHSGGDQDRPQGAHLCPGAFGFLRGWGRICLSTSRTRKSTRSGTLTLSNMTKGVSADDEGTLHQSQSNRHALHPLHTSIPELPVRKESSHSRSLQQLQVVQQLQRTQHSKQPGG